MREWKVPLYKIYTDDEDLDLITKIIKQYLNHTKTYDNNMKTPPTIPAFHIPI